VFTAVGSGRSSGRLWRVLLIALERQWRCILPHQLRRRGRIEGIIIFETRVIAYGGRDRVDAVHPRHTMPM
jgi:hypothetical protein